jgi:hypothetical protein
VIAGLCSAVSDAQQPGVVATTDGRTLEGEVVEEADRVVVTIHGIATPVPREQVARIDYTPFADRFAARLASLGPRDIDGRMELAQDALARREYALALKAARAARDIDVVNRAARDLENAINAQMRLDAIRPDGEPPTPRPPRTTRPVRPDVGPRLLGMDQVQMFRLAELTEDDSRARIQFRENVRQRFLEDKPMIPFRRFATRSAVAQALDIRESGSPDLWRDVVITNDPESLATFFRRLHGPVVQGCATSRCHGGPDAGALRLISPAQSTEAAYTNLYLLMKYVKEIPIDESRPFGAGSSRLIERGQGPTSLLAQFMLPRSQAIKPHPDVKGFRGVVRDREHPIFRAAVRWMDQELSPSERSHGIEHDPWRDPDPAELDTAPASPDQAEVKP